MERTNITRQRCEDGAFALIKGADGSCNVGTITDINLAGMSFNYITSGNVVIRPFELTLFLTHKPFMSINHILCRPVYDHAILGFSVRDIAVRRCGVKFEGLEPARVSMLTTFLNEIAGRKLTVGDPPRILAPVPEPDHASAGCAP